ncbi:MAG: hypothetical protein QOD77_2156 [Thermoplasmata archaeon]|nr:hypothetical protein [Thermoplasmata archaeon]
MARVVLDSESLRWVDYDVPSQTLKVEFRHGGEYHYLGVPRAVYRKLMGAESRGAFFTRNVRNNYRTLRVR